jgi:glycosyltransferase involved in cell wall biosynthesis
VTSGSQRAPYRCLVVGSTVSPYLVELFDRVAATPGHDVLFVHRSRRDASSFEHEWAGSSVRAIREGRAWSASSVAAVLRLHPNAVICLGHTSPLNLATSLACRIFFRAKAFYFGDTNGHQTIAECRTTPRARVFLAAKRLLLGHLFPTSLDLGATNRAAAKLMGIARGLTVPLYSVNFESLGDAQPLEAMRTMESPRLLCVSRLVEQKNLETLLRSWRRHLAAGGAGSLTVVGGGPLRGRLEDEIDGLPKSRVQLAGAVPREQRGAAFAAADGLVLPSTKEPWGIVVTEALGLGIPVLASRAVGAARSLKAMAGGAVELCGTTAEALERGLAAFVDELPERRREAQRVSAAIRRHYGMGGAAARVAGVLAAAAEEC